MSGLLESILSAGGGSALQSLAGRFGLPPAMARSALEALLPMVSGGLKNQAQNEGGVEGLLGKVLKPGHSDFGDDPSVLTRPDTTEKGNELLGSIFNNDREVSRTVAAQAAEKTGLDVSVLKKMLPIVAMLAAGALARNANSGGVGNMLGAGRGNGDNGGMIDNIIGAVTGRGGQDQRDNAASHSGALGGLGRMLDLDRDGNPLDDIMRMLGKR